MNNDGTHILYVLTRRDVKHEMKQYYWLSNIFS